MKRHAIDTLWRQMEWHPNAVTTHRCAVAGFDGSYASRGALAYATGWAKRNLAGLEGIADALQADAIVIGRSGHGRCMFRGSVARRLVASSRRIVVVVP